MAMYTPQQNYFLAALAPDAQARLFPHLELIFMPLGTAVLEAGSPLNHAYFPTDCILAQSYVTEEGESAQLAMVGNEGFIGISMLLSGEAMPHRLIVQSEGCAYRLAARSFKAEFDRHDETERLMLRYAQSLITQMAQTVVCNRHHVISQQLCRWLLLSLNRLPSDDVVTTQELIGNLLGVRREGVTIAIRELQRVGAIHYNRGRITILDRVKLEQMSCECYSVVKRETDRLLHYVPRTRQILKAKNLSENQKNESGQPYRNDTSRKP